ncbi:hypothetical protein D3C73_1023980 [compost metagenome]
MKADATMPGSEAGNAVETPAVGGGGSVPSMVKPAEGGAAPSAPNTVAEAPAAADTANLAEKADARQVQNTTAPMEVAARTAEVQSSTQSAKAADTYGGMDMNMGRLIKVNEMQLDTLIELVDAIKSGGLPSTAPGQAAQPQQASTQTTQNPSINTPRPAPKGVVSVGRV